MKHFVNSSASLPTGKLNKYRNLCLANGSHYGGIRGRAGVEVGTRTRPDWGITHCGPPSHFHLLTPPAHCFSIDNLIYFSNSFRTRGGATCKPGVASTPLFISQQRALERRPSAAVKTAQTAHALGRGLHPYVSSLWHINANHIRTITLHFRITRGVT